MKQLKLHIFCQKVWFHLKVSNKHRKTLSTLYFFFISLLILTLPCSRVLFKQLCKWSNRIKISMFLLTIIKNKWLILCQYKDHYRGLWMHIFTLHILHNTENKGSNTTHVTYCFIRFHSCSVHVAEIGVQLELSCFGRNSARIHLGSLLSR